MSVQVTELLEEHSRLKAERQQWDTINQEISELVVPNQADFTHVFSRGDNRRRQIFDGTGEHANDIFASSLVGLMANPATKWFQYGILDDELSQDDEVKAWLELASKLALNAFNQANAKFYGHLKSNMTDVGCFGEAAMSIDLGVDSLLAFNAVPVHSLYYEENFEGNVDLTHRVMELTIRQLLQNEEQLGWDISPKVKEAAAHGVNKKIEVIHIIKPRENRNPDGITALDKPFASIWLDKENQKVMFESGFDQHNMPVGRWDKSSREIRGRGPARVALADIKMLQQSSKAFMMAADKNLNPSLMITSESSMGNIDLSPGAQNFLKKNQTVEAFNSNGSLPFHDQWEEQRRDAIRRAFFVDQLQIQGSVQMTATEILQRQNEKARLIAPSVGRLNGELLGPIVERALLLLMNRIMPNGQPFIPVPPPQLAGQDIKVIYISPISRAQKEQEVQTIVGFGQTIGGLAQFEPAVLDKIDFDAAVDEIGDSLDIPASILRTDDELDIIRDAKAQQQQLQATAQGAQQVAETAKTANEAGLI